MSFSRETPIKAIRKARPCDACKQTVTVGEPAISWAGVTDGDFYAVIWHPECRAAELALNKLHGSYPDEWISLGFEVDSEDYPYLMEEHPVVAERMGLPGYFVGEIVEEIARLSDAALYRAKREMGR